MKLEVAENLFIDVPANLAKIYKEFEPLTTSVITENLRQGEVFVDIGANIGYFSALASRCVGESGAVLAIEASPDVLPILVANTASLKNVTILNSAVGNHQGLTDFYLTDDYVNSGVSLNPFLTDARKISVPINTIDYLLGQRTPPVKKVDFIKCDVQGDEIAVLHGAKELIAASNNLRLIIEWAPSWMKKAGYEPNALPAILESMGFVSIVIIDDWLQKVMSVEEMRTEFANDTSSKRFCNVFASKA